MKTYKEEPSEKMAETQKKFQDYKETLVKKLANAPAPKPNPNYQSHQFRSRVQGVLDGGRMTLYGGGFDLPDSFDKQELKRAKTTAEELIKHRFKNTYPIRLLKEIIKEIDIELERLNNL